MADFTMKANDTRPSIVAHLDYDDGSEPDLSDPATTVQFIMRKVVTSGTVPAPKVKAAAVIEDAAQRIVRYDWLPTDTNTPGDYLGEWEVTFPDGGVQTFPTAEYHDITILP